MAHTYVIQSVQRIGTTDDVQITGTVDGIPVQVHVWFSALTQQATAVLAQQNVIAPAMLSAIPQIAALPTYQGTITI